jgi:methoxymalonate biosynthesis acyl carrier protein
MRSSDEPHEAASPITFYLQVPATMSEQQTKQRIAGFFSRHLPAAALDGDQDIFALGFVNSLFALQIVLFVEKEFGVHVDNEDLDLGNFRSINALAGFVARKQAALAS